jgi:hypothetical protein
MGISKLRIHSGVRTLLEEVLVGLMVSMSNLDRQEIKEAALEIFFQNLKKCSAADSKVNKYKTEAATLC